MKTAFLGLGRMGRPMAENLLTAGFDLTVWNRSKAPVAALADAGADTAESAIDAVRDKDVVITMLADDHVAREVLVASGALDAMNQGAIHVNMATVSHGFACEMAALHDEHGLAYVASPVMGRSDMAAERKLNILAGGPEKAIEYVRPLLEAIGQKVWPVGDAPERANVIKIQINLMLAIAIDAMGQASALGEVYDVPTADFLEIATQTLFACPAYQSYGRLISNSDYEPANMPARLGNKDVGLALSLAEQRAVPLPLAAVARDTLSEMIANGDGDKDWGAMAEVAARRAHTDRARD